MASCKEIITLQFGDFANFVGAHYFNIQEAGFSFNPSFVPEIDNKILFREEKTSFTPRLVLVGSKKSILSKEKDEFNLDSLKESLGFDIEVQQQNEELNMDIDNPDDVRWRDLLNVNYHEKSFNSIEITESEEICDVPSFQNGKNIWKRDSFSEDFTDDIRFQMEACDNAQGFQILIEAKSQFSGIGASCLEYLNDEYTKKEKFSILLYDKVKSNENVLRNYCGQLFTCSQLIVAASEHSDLVLPLSTFESVFNSIPRSFPDIKFIDSYYHTSSILATGLELFTLPYRKRDRITLSNATSSLNFLGRNILTSAIALPFEKHGCFYDTLKAAKYVTLTPDVTKPYFKNNDLLFMSSKGISDDIIIWPEASAEALKYHYFYETGNTKTIAHCVKDKLRIPKNFPDIFNNYKTPTIDPSVLEEMKIVAQQAGCKPEELTIEKLRSLAAIGSIANSSNVIDFLKVLDLKANKSTFRMISNYEQYITKSDLEQTAESLITLMYNYDSNSYL